VRFLRLPARLRLPRSFSSRISRPTAWPFGCRRGAVGPVGAHQVCMFPERVHYDLDPLSPFFVSKNVLSSPKNHYWALLIETNNALPLF
jgi:hypothetical protein